MAGKIDSAFQRQNWIAVVMTELGFTSSKNTLTIGLEELTIMRPEFQSYSRNTLTLGLETLL